MIFDFSYLILMASNKYYIHITFISLSFTFLTFWPLPLHLLLLCSFSFLSFPLPYSVNYAPFETNASLILLFWIQSPLAIQRDTLFRVYWLISHINSFVLSLVFDWSLHIYMYTPTWMTKLVLREIIYVLLHLNK